MRRPENADVRQKYMKLRAIALIFICFSAYCGCSREKWAEFSPPNGEFSILMPGIPEKREKSIPLKSYGNQKMVFYGANGGEANYSITFCDYPAEFVKKAGANLMLGAGIQQYAARPDIKIERDEQNTAFNCPTRKTEFMMTDVGYRTSLTTFLDGNRVYIIQVVRPSDSISQRVVDRFMTSFRLLNRIDE